MCPVSMTPFAAPMVPAGAVYGFCTTVRLAVGFAGLDGFIEAHGCFLILNNLSSHFEAISFALSAVMFGTES